MTVQEMIDHLSKLPLDAKIYVWSFVNGDLEEPLILSHDNDSLVELVAKSDDDLKG